MNKYSNQVYISLGILAGSFIFLFLGVLLLSENNGIYLENEDVYGMLFLKMFVYGLDKFTNIKHLVIDEMQDYSPIQMYILYLRL